MTKKADYSYSPAPGVASILLAVVLIALAFKFELQLIPFGGVAVALVVLGACMLAMRRNEGCYASLLGAMMICGAGLVFPIP